MISRTLGTLVVVALVLTTVGCSKVKFYAVDRPRVDQAILGNSGYVNGQKKNDDSSAERPTRRIYVFEVDRKNQQKAGAQAQAKPATTKAPQAEAQNVQGSSESAKQGLTIPYIGDDGTASAPENVQANVSSDAQPKAGTTYTVLKDDTLQKISKKVYGSFGKWTKIYDANKDKIKNPNFVKPGTVLVIPVVE